MRSSDAAGWDFSHVGHLLLDSSLLEPKNQRHLELCVCISALCLSMLQEQSCSPAKTSCSSGKCPEHSAPIPRGTACLPLPGTPGQVPALALGLGTACFQLQCHGKQSKQEQMCPWALLPISWHGQDSFLCPCAEGPPCQSLGFAQNDLGRKVG